MSSKRRLGSVGTQFDSLPSGAFGPNQSRKWAEFTDGLSNTALMGEVKSYQN